MVDQGLAAFGLNPLDTASLALVNGLAGRTVALDWALHFLIGVDLVKLGVPVGLALYAWLDPNRAEPPMARAHRVTWSLLGVLVAIGLGRAIQDGLPSRPRPRIALPGFEFPDLLGQPNLAEWSSFPSDHAVLAAALATAAWARSRRLGLVAAAWAVLVVAFPRLYFGYHYVTDLLAGALFGTLVTLAVMRLGRWRVLPELWLAAERRAPVLLTLGLFVLAYEFVCLFQTTRGTLRAARELLQAIT